MATTKVAISLDSKLLQQLDRLVAERIFPNRSRGPRRNSRQTRPSGTHATGPRVRKLDVSAERELADEGLAKDVAEWPEY